MADSLHHNPQSRSSKTIRENKTIKMKTRIKDRHNQSDSRTPPLPTKNFSSIDTLLRKRESLKKELQQMDNTKNKPRNKRECNSHSYTQQKRYKIYCEIEDNVKKPKQATSDVTHKVEHLQPIDSEDEDDIIEQRRKRRKLLLEKLGDLKNQQSFKMNVSRSNQTTDLREDNERHNIAASNKMKPEATQITTDMFAELDSSSKSNVPDKVTQVNNSQLEDNWDDPEGYYNVRIGEIIHNKQYTIKNILGQGVFANVVSAYDNCNNQSVAIKIIRNNDLMYNTGLKEISILKSISDGDPDKKYHCVSFISHFIHKKHLCIVLEPLFIDMRCVIKKYGRHGINIKAVISYSRQLLLALKLLKKIGVIHADIKPDNILVNEKKNILKLCDFGSAARVGECEITPYLVSRFYRAPEIILGIPYKHGVDMWSTACTIFEMATGKILFTGSSNNKMLKTFMDIKGKLSHKLIRKGKFKDQHFNYNNNFLIHTTDECTGREKVVEMCNITASKDLLTELKKYCKNLKESDDKKLLQLKDILERMLALDSNHRPSIEECLKHAFIKEDFDK